MSIELENEIKKLRNENTLLKEENADLKRQIEVLTKVPYDENRKVSLFEYYSKKYLEMYDETYISRINRIDEEVNNLNLELSKLTDVEHRDELIEKDNSEIDERINNINLIIEENINLIEQKKQIILKHQYELNETLLKLKQRTIDVYNSFINPIKEENYETFINDFQKLIHIVQHELKDTTTKISILKNKVTEEKQLFESQIQEIEINNRTLRQELKELENRKILKSEENIDLLIEEIKSDISNKQILKVEIQELFENVKQKHLKLIKDEIEHFQVIEFANRDIALAMDEFLLKLVDELINLDTQNNIQMQKMVQLNHLYEKRETLNTIEEQYQTTLNEYEYIQGIYNTVNAQIEKIEKYVNDFEKVLETNVVYRKYNERYRKLVFDLNNVTLEIERLTKELEETKKYRQSKVQDPFGSSEIAKINQKMSLLQSELERKIEIKNQIAEVINKDKMDKRLVTLINIINDVMKCEEALPKFYQKLREVAMLVDEKYQQLQTLKHLVETLHEIDEEIEKLENEINNK